MALYAWRVAKKDADVVEHGRLLDKLPIEFQLGMSLHNAQGPLRHLPTMYKENAPQRILLWIILVYDFLKVHRRMGLYRLFIAHSHWVGALNSKE